MLTITLDESGRQLNISAAYPYKDRIKNLPGAYFDRSTKLWQISVRYLADLMTMFKGELYFKTPLWEIKGEPAPDVSADYAIDPSIKLPEMKIPLYPYQAYGAKFIIDKINQHNFVICADGVGLGKTPTGITVLKWMTDNKDVKHILLVVKKSIKIQWKEEIDKFSDLSSKYKIVYTGDTKAKRMKAYNAALEEEYSVLITSYHNFLNDKTEIAGYKPEFVIIDEAHCVKARDGIINNNIAAVISEVPTLFLTGTPIMSRPEDIFGIVSMSSPCYFDPETEKDFQWKNFKKKYLVTQFHMGYEQTIGAKNLDELRDKCQNIVIRRTEKEVAVNMPETVEKDIFVEPDELQMDMFKRYSDEEDSLNAEYEDLKAEHTPEAADQQNKIENVMKGMLAVRQLIASDPLILKDSKSNMVKPYIKMIPKEYKSSPKTDMLVNELEEILDAGEKAIIFTKYVTTGLYISEVIKKKLKINTLMYSGREDQEQRSENVKLFRESDEYNILIGTDAMAEGINLAEARHVINYDLPDTYAIYTQRTGRARRVSSKYSSVIVHNLLTYASADISKYNQLKKNQNLDGALIAGNSAQTAVLSKVSNMQQ